MNVTALKPGLMARTHNAGQAEPNPPADNNEPKESVRFSVGKAAAGLGGAAVGYVGANLATTAVSTVALGTGSLPGLLQLTVAALPKVEVSAELAGLVQNGLVSGFAVGALVGTAAAIGAGAAIAYHAAAGAQLADPTAAPATESKGFFNQLGSEFRQSGAEMNAQLHQVAQADSYGGAAKAGAFAGASLAGPVGAYAGKFQGMFLGAAIGAVACLPLMQQIHPALGLIGVVAGGATGAAIGEPVGHFAGSVAGAAVGAVGGAAYHAVRG
ncbi:MAG: hypothetical protein AB7S38_21305 [Vulcanimicrobiota bacterium]